MAKPSDAAAEVSAALDQSGRTSGAPHNTPAAKEISRARRVEALSMRLAGLPIGTIAERLGISESRVTSLIDNLLTTAENRTVAHMRALENARVDRAQAAIWARVLEGDIKAVSEFRRLSEHRAKMNGLNVPQQVDLSVSVRREMQTALAELDHMLEAEVIEEVVSDDGDTADTPE